MKTTRHHFSKHQFPTLIIKGASGGRNATRRGTGVKVGSHDAEKALRAGMRRPLGKLTHKHTRFHWIIDEERP